MYYYFSSNYPAVVKLNGIYYGTIHNSIKSVNIETENPLVEVCPLNGVERSSCFILDKQFLVRPPRQVLLTDLKGGYMLKFIGAFAVAEFRVLAQQKFHNSVVTVFSENGYKISVETQTDFLAENIQMQVDFVKLLTSKTHANLIAVFIYGQNNLINVYDISNKITKVFSREVASAEFNDNLVTVEEFLDMAKHKVTTEWELSGREFIAKSRKVESHVNFEREKLNQKVLPYAFLEELLVGGDYKWYLKDNVLENADKLKGFFGEFIGVMPPPVFRDIEEVGLIYAKDENLYNVEYFRFELKEGKIVNITC